MTINAAVGFIPTFTIHDRLRKAREAACLEQAELAEQIGVSRASISAYESGRVAKPRRIVVNAWSLATGVPVQWLITGIAPTPEDDGAPAAGDRGSAGLPRLDSNQQPSD
ncbi:XRE family transcriptional regulator [Actinomyces sp. 432]|uniref:helix-turn-helix domain-containing protein n=1 Tax=Actinomyces sp. 432 TaxID=2057798 RepID=UPI0013745836|nr:XRE family transcriptional regulator [Actinomyces sp. 432]